MILAGSETQPVISGLFRLYFSPRWRYSARTILGMRVRDASELPASMRRQLGLAHTRARPHKGADKHERKIASVRKCRAVARCHGTLVVLSFAGALMPTINDLLGTRLQTRIRYRNAWHAAVARAVKASWASGLFAPTEPVHIIVTRATRTRAADRDNLNSKYAIDGLRRAGLIPDDRPDFVLGVHEQQRRGEAHVSMILLPQSHEASLPALLRRARDGRLFTVAVDSPVDNLSSP